MLERLELIAEPRRLLVRLLADGGLELALELAHPPLALRCGLILARRASDVTRGAVDALEELARVRPENFVVLRAAHAALLAELEQRHAAIGAGHARIAPARLRHVEQLLPQVLRGPLDRRLRKIEGLRTFLAEMLLVHLEVHMRRVVLAVARCCARPRCRAPRGSRATGVVVGVLVMGSFGGDATSPDGGAIAPGA